MLLGSLSNDDDENWEKLFAKQVDFVVDNLLDFLRI